jgi:hypothetical protein
VFTGFLYHSNEISRSFLKIGVSYFHILSPVMVELIVSNIEGGVKQ